MSNASSKRSVMTLFSNKNDIYCHQVKIVLAEKGVAYENEEVDLQALSEDLMELNPYGTLPTLVDRDLLWNILMSVFHILHLCQFIRFLVRKAVF